MTTTPKKSPAKSVGAVVHRLPGRLRVRIDRLRDDTAYGSELQHAVSAISGVITVRINPLASSIVVTYLASKLPEQTLLDYLGVSLPTPAPTDVDGKTEERASQQPNAPASLNKEAEDLTAEVTGGSVGETIGEAVGEAVGEALLGPLGMAIGAAIGGEIGGQIGEAGGLDVEKLIDSKLQNRQTQRHNRKNTQRGT